MLTKLTIPLFLAVAIAPLLRADSPKNARVNIALDRPYTLEPVPDYPHTKDANDLKDLTDGVYGSDPDGRGLWMLKSSVGWRFSTPLITIDLGSVQPIDGVSFSTGAGDGGVAFLRQLSMFVSDDNIHWRYVAQDLVEHSNRVHGLPPQKGVATWRYTARELQTSGRYVALAPEPYCLIFEDKNYVFCDEIEVYQGSGDLPVNPGVPLEGEGRESLHHFLRVNRVRYGIRHRIGNDISALRSVVKKLPEEEQAPLLGELKRLESEMVWLPVPDLESFDTVLPLNPTHAKVFALAAKLMRKQGIAPLTLFKQHRYQLPPYLTISSDLPKGEPALDIEMMRGEYRADAFNLLNAGSEPMEVQLKVNGLPDFKSWLTVSAVPWTDTLQLQPVAAALPELALDEKGTAAFQIPAGMVRKLWFNVDSNNLSPGKYEGEVEISTAGAKHRIPFSIRVSSVSLGTPRITFGMWDYTYGDSYGGINAKNREAAIRMMRSHYVNIPWAMGGVLSRPDPDDFDGQDALREPLAFTAFDTWVERWPDARSYMIFLNAGRAFAGVGMEDPSFEKRVTAWIKAFTEHLDQKGIAHSRVVLELVDEPHTNEQDEIIVTWNRLLKKAAPGLQIFQNPTWLNPNDAKYQDALRKPDIISPYIRQYESGGSTAVDYFRNRPEGQQLWFYICAGPVRTLDPTHYYRSRMWWVFAHGGAGMNIWAFGDVGSDWSLGTRGDSWNEYDSLTPGFSPVFIRPDGVTTSLHWEAAREGIQDYEYLAKLRDALNASTAPDGWKERAQRVLEKAPLEIMGSEPFSLSWTAAPEALAERPDTWRREILSLLEELPTSTTAAQP